ncbi:MAG: MotA/TolQ/ExbB proton channel family protein [Gammaproteobacteria bacterium]
MDPLLEATEQIREFLERGGDVLLLILLLVFLLWILIFERLVYYRVGHNRLEQQVVDRWEARPERVSRAAHDVRTSYISEVKEALRRNLPMIKSIIAVAPLFGLLGTVTGMVEVFDVMAAMGTGSARAMASGISKATIPTMAGMVAALTGLLGINILERMERVRRARIEARLTFDH